MTGTVQPQPTPEPREDLAVAPGRLAVGTATRLRIAVAHDWLVGLRGGERVLDAILKVVDEVGELDALYVMFDNHKSLTPAIDHARRAGAPIGEVPLLSNALRRWMLPLYPGAVANLSRQLAHSAKRRKIDLLISTSSAAVKNITPPPGVPHLSYVHSPPRYLWHLGDEYAGGFRGVGLRLFGKSLRRWDKRGSDGVTRFLANSHHTANQIRECYGRDSHVVHPPVRTEFFTPPPDSDARAAHWLVVSALEPYKRVDLAIAAANKAKHELRIIGGGSMEGRLRRLAGPTVKFLGRVDDDSLRHEYRTARVLLFPQVEDFGIVAAEALACGLPVVAQHEGGALDIVDDGETGRLFAMPSKIPSRMKKGLQKQFPGPPGMYEPVEALLTAIASAPQSSPACRAAAERFSEAAFAAKLHVQVQETLAQTQGD